MKSTSIMVAYWQRLWPVALVSIGLSTIPANGSSVLAGFGTGSFAVEAAATTAAYSQTAEALLFRSAVSLGDTVGGLINPFDFSAIGTGGLGLSMRVNGANPNLTFSLELLDAEFGRIAHYTGSTVGATEAPSFLELSLSPDLPGTLSGQVHGLQFTWDDGGAIDADLIGVVASTSPQPEPTPGPTPTVPPTPTPSPTPAPPPPAPPPSTPVPTPPPPAPTPTVPPTPTPSPSPTPPPTPTPSPSPSPSPTPAASPTPPASPTPTPTASPSPAPSPTPDATPDPGTGPGLPDLSVLALEVTGLLDLGPGTAQLGLRLNRGILTGQLRWSGRSRALNGRLDEEGKASFAVAGLSAPLHVAVAQVKSAEGEVIGNPYLEASVGEAETSPLWPVAANGKSDSRFVMAGWRFTAVLPGSEVSGVSAFAMLRANAKGGVRLVGRLADGKPFTASARAVRDQRDGSIRLPVLIRRPSDGLEISGHLLVNNAPGPEELHLSGDLRQRVGGSAKRLQMAGLRWERPAPGTNALDRTASPADFSVSIGDTSWDVALPVSNRLNDRASGLKVLFVPASGLISGRVESEAFRGRLHGVLLQEDLMVADFGMFRGSALLLRKSGGIESVVFSINHTAGD